MCVCFQCDLIGVQRSPFFPSTHPHLLWCLRAFGLHGIVSLGCVFSSMFVASECRFTFRLGKLELFLWVPAGKRVCYASGLHIWDEF